VEFLTIIIKYFIAPYFYYRLLRIVCEIQIVAPQCGQITIEADFKTFVQFKPFLNWTDLWATRNSTDFRQELQSCFTVSQFVPAMIIFLLSEV